MTATVLGASGFLGRHLAERWPAALLPPLRLLLHRSRPDWLGRVQADLRSIDLNDPSSFATALDGSTLLINLLRPRGDGGAATMLKTLLPAITSSSIRAIVHCSSIDVFGDADDTPITEQTVALPHTPYAREHLAIETLFAQSATQTTILRLGAVFGFEGRNLVKQVREVALDPDWKLSLRRSLYGKRRMHLVSVETVADVIRFAALRQPDAPVEHLLVTEDEAEENNFAFVQDRLAAAFGRTVASVPALPPWCLRLALAVTGRDATHPYRRISGSRLNELGFRPEAAFAQRIEQYASIAAREYLRAPA